jgi:TonB-dependent receptor
VSSNPELAPVAALNGEVRQLLVWDGTAGSNQRYFSNRDVKSVSDNVSLSGKTTRGKFDFDYTFGYVRGTTKNPREVHFMMFHSAQTGFDPAWVDSRAIDPIEGRIISPYGERTGRGYPLPFLTEEGFAHFNDVDNYLSPFGQLLAGEGFDRRGTGEASVRFDAGGRFFKYLEAGVNFEQATFWTEQSDSFDFFAACLSCPVSELGLAFDEPGLAAIGQRGGFSVASRANFESFAGRLESLADGPDPLIAFLPVALDPRARDQFTRENNLATYFQARFDVGKLEVIGGARLSRVEAQTVRLQNPQLFDQDRVPDQDFMLQFTRLLDLSAVATDVLPRVLLNYRHSDKLIFRGGYFLTTARPSVSDLSQEQYVSLSLWPFEYHDFITNTDHPLLQVEQGNPGLEPTVTHNFDLSAEYYHDQIGLMRISGFYKRSDNLIETNETILRRGSARTPGALDDLALPDHPSFDPASWPDNLIVQTSLPVNSEDPAHLWGIEVGVERQLTFLPGVWSGFGVYANVAYTSGSKTEKLIWYHPDVLDDEGNVVQLGFEEIVKKRDQPYGQQSAYTGTASLTYNKYGIDATLAYSLQARALSGFQGFGLAAFSEEVGTLDLKIARRFATSLGTFTVSFEGADLLKGTSSPDLESSVGSSGYSGKYYTEGGFIGGRQFRLGVGASF